MKRIIFSFIFLLSFSQSLSSFAWGKRGHGIVAQVAFSMLDEGTRQRVNKYIGDMSLEQAANWMDELKGDHRNDYMKVWHYVNLEKGETYQDTKDPNSINQLERVIEELNHREHMKDDEIRTDLLVLFHLVGDLHQPLHDGYGSDRGGNNVNVKYKGNYTNLHRVWDTEIIETENITLADCLKQSKRFSKEDIAMFSTIDPKAWMRQPRSLLTSVYNFKDDTIDEEYVKRHRKIIEEELYLGGVRLAAVLKAAFKA